MLERVAGGGKAVETAIGNVPTTDALDLSGLDLDEETMAKILEVDNDEWRAEIPIIEKHYQFVGERLPVELKDELDHLEKRLAG
ncbi:MAG: phosphoenolpyruvate carboxykinase domain-containing protein [Acidimicrobiia bacterium]|nr:phosphoenolpyruvate carboxykinase domain-containing protein [Acidimicrobiia bacterium]